MSLIVENKKAKFEYEIVEKFQAGLSLTGKFVKVIRKGAVNLSGLYIVHQDNQLQIIGLEADGVSDNITLLLSKKEKDKIIGLLKVKGYTAVVLNMKAVGRWLKADVAVVKGKSDYDKRQSIKKRDLDREGQRGLY